MKAHLDIISNGFLDIMNKNNCFPNIRVFLLLDNPINLKHRDYIKYNNIIKENKNRNGFDGNFLFEKHNIIYSFHISSLICFSSISYQELRDNVIKDTLLSIDIINTHSNKKN
jgi:hypothetical protein